jgi:hypothetical protein
MAIDIDDLVPVDDQKFGPDEDSVLETLFPESFYVVSANGLYLTSVTNFDIFQQVLDRLEEHNNPADKEFREELAVLMEDADELSQDEYDEAYERSSEDDEDADEEEYEKGWDE